MVVAFLLAQVGFNVNLDIPLTIGGGHKDAQPAAAVEHLSNCDNLKYNCARRLPNEATQLEINDALKKYGVDVKVFAHGDKIWYIVGPHTRGIPQ